MERFRLAKCRLALKSLAIALAFGVAIVPPALATDEPHAIGSFDEGQTRDVEEIVRGYLLEHPEVIIEAIDKLQQEQQLAEEQRLREAAGAIRPVSAEDHIRGNPDAPVKVIEFSDFECPFCKRFHQTMALLMDEYADEDDVVWVYRHFPLDSLHSKARKEAQAAECANDLGGNDAFWAFADRIFEVTPSNDGLDLTMLPKIADEIGLDQAKFEACLQGDARGGKHAAHIEEDYQDAIASGGSGTPYTVVVGPSGQTYPINGAQPQAAVKSIVDLALAEAE